MQQAFCIIGNGGQAPGVYKLLNTQNQLQLIAISAFAPGQSVYRVALSPMASAIAASTKAGHIKVFAQKDNVHSVIADFQYLTARNPHVTGLAFASENTLLAAGTDNKIRVLNTKTKERINLINLPGIAFGLQAVNNELCACICRQAGADHLMVWNINNAKAVFTGPSFKINNEYLMAPLIIDDEHGVIAHTDRFGRVYLYDINNAFRTRTFDAGHGNFYGLTILNGKIFTAGYSDGGRFKQWDFEQLKNINEATPFQSPIMALGRFDAEHIIAASVQGQLILIYGNKPDIISQTQLNDIRHLAPLPASVIINIHNVSKNKYLEDIISKIKEHFEAGQDAQAHQLISKLEKEGYELYALNILAMAEKEKGLLLNEMETLMMLLQRNPQGDELQRILTRLAEIFENVHEPEMALHIISLIIENGANESLYNTKIQTLADKCIPPDTAFVLMTGFPSVDFIKPEFRKAEILKRFFQAAIAWIPDNDSAKIQKGLTIEQVAHVIEQTNQTLFKTHGLIEAVIKEGEIIAGPVRMLRLIPEVKLPEFIEIWIEPRQGIDQGRLLVHKIFYPHADEYDENWNFEMLTLFEKVITNQNVNEWFDKCNKIIRAAIVELEHGEEDDIFSFK